MNPTKIELPVLDLKIVRSWNPCYDPAKHLAEDWEGTALDILRLNKVPADDRFWAVLRKESGVPERTQRLFACWCAREALKLLPPAEIDPRSVKAIEVSEAFADGKASQEDLAAARDAARDAAWAAAWDAARDAARDAAWDAAWAAAWDAARDAARAAARAAAWDAAWAAAWDAARAAAWAAARDAAWAAARDAQIKQLISMIS